jgi:uncharacterized protein (TIGR02145 family)
LICMRRFDISLVAALLANLALFSACDDENESPEVEITLPADGEIFLQGSLVDVKAEAHDPDGSLKWVTFYVDGTNVLRDSLSPYQYQWNTEEATVEDHRIKAVATDNEGKATGSEIIVTIDVPGGFNPDLEYGTMTDQEGNSYQTIRIGDQTWMAENLKVTQYADGTPIPLVTDSAAWAELDPNSMAYCWYGNDAASKDLYGGLYNWAASSRGAVGSDTLVTGIQGVCPDGWHLPAETEWQELESFLGMSAERVEATEWRGSNYEGGKLKEVGFSHWEKPNTSATNESGFTALPGGFRGMNGAFYGHYATYWTATEKSESEQAWYRALNYNKGLIYRHYHFKKLGFSIRCVADQ